MLTTVTTLIANLLNKGLMVIFFISCLYSLRHLVLFTMKMISGEKYEMTPKHLLYLGGSLALILTIIFSGFKLM